MELEFINHGDVLVLGVVEVRTVQIVLRRYEIAVLLVPFVILGRKVLGRNELGIEHQDLHSAYDAVIHLETQTYNTNTIDQKDERTIEQERKYDADIQDEYYDHENTFVIHADGISSHKRLQKTCDLVTDVVNRKIFGDKAPALPTHIIRQLTENLPPELAKEKEQELRSRTIESVKNQEPIHYDGSYKSFREIQLRESTLENTPQYSPRSQKSDFDITD